MNGAHDIGGTHGFGPIEYENDEPVFHAEWERRIFALSMAVGEHDLWNLDQSRHANESMNPAHYLTADYYKRWLNELETLLVKNKIVKQEEIDHRVKSMRAKKT